MGVGCQWLLDYTPAGAPEALHVALHDALLSDLLRHESTLTRPTILHYVGVWSIDTIALPYRACGSTQIP